MIHSATTCLYSTVETYGVILYLAKDNLIDIKSFILRYFNGGMLNSNGKPFATYWESVNPTFATYATTFDVFIVYICNT